MKMTTLLPPNSCGKPLRCGAMSLALLTAGLVAQPDNPSATTPMAANQTVAVRVRRATEVIGTDVIGRDGRKVGDIVDYAFDLQGPPRLDYVLVMTGGFLELGGEVRAVPASALSFDGDTAHIGLTREQYLGSPIIGRNRVDFLSDASNRAAIAGVFRANNNASARPASPADASASSSLVLFSAMRNGTAYSTSTGRLGYIDDAWISLDRDRAPYVEITPAFEPFRLPGEQRYAVPMAAMHLNRENPGFDFSISTDDLLAAKSVDDTEGVRLLQSGELDDTTILRVTLPRVATVPTGNQAGAPTGRMNPKP